MLVNQSVEDAANALLRSISNDLRTPLVSIQGALSYLREEAARGGDGTDLDDATRQTLIENAAEEADRLNRLIGNILDAARMDAGAFYITPSPCDVQDVIGSALERLKGPLADRHVSTDISPELPLVPMDFTWMVKVLVHLLDNAVKHSASGSPISVAARIQQAQLVISVADRGIGIPPADLSRIFDKFYHVPRKDQAAGAGLGLTICREVLTAHGGSIEVTNRDGGGVVATVRLPSVRVANMIEKC